MQTQPTDTPDNTLPRILITLLKGVIYEENNPALWQSLLSLQARVRDHMALLGLELMLDEAEGYAWLKSRVTEDDEPELPRLMVRRPLSFPVSLLLALLRKKLAETDAGGEDQRLILSREDMLELVRVFMPGGSNEARLVKQVDSSINKIVQLGFLRKLRSDEQRFEVRRILKAFVDAQWLQEFDQRLAEYQQHALQTQPEGADD